MCGAARDHHVTLSYKDTTADYYFMEKAKLR